MLINASEKKTLVLLLALLHPKFNQKYKKTEQGFGFDVRPGELQVSLPRFRQLCNLQPTNLKVKQSDT